MKSIMKEMVIVLLLILAILLVLGIFLYDYIPMNKVVPKIEQYEVPNSIKEELSEDVDDTQNTMTPIVREINSNDLKIYEKSKNYQKGKVNPFADITNTATSNTSNGNGSNVNNQNTNKTDTQGNYLPNSGTK